MEESLKEITQDAERIVSKISGAASDLFAMGAEAERIVIFASLRNLIDEKRRENDANAENILGWAYERLGKD